MKQTLFLILGASLCLSACGAAGKPTQANQPAQETTALIQPETNPEPPVEPAQETTLPQQTPPEPENDALVRIRDHIPDILVELKYATADNFTNQVIYDFQDAYLRYGTVKKLKAAQESLGEIGLGLKVWDGFRPVSAQFKLWEVYPDDTYVADPRVGFSNHNRGCAVDVTLVDRDGSELEMPTAFDDFSGRADRDYSECSQIAAENATLLETIMERYGFKGYYGEWWHFNDTVRYDVEKEFDPKE